MGIFGDLWKHWNTGPPCTEFNGIHSLFKAACLTFLYYIFQSDLWRSKMVFPKPVPKLEGSKRIKVGTPLAVSVYLYLQDCNAPSVQFFVWRVIQNYSNEKFFYKLELPISPQRVYNIKLF